MTFLPICRYADIGDCRYADIADIFMVTRNSLLYSAKSGARLEKSFWLMKSNLRIFSFLTWQTVMAHLNLIVQDRKYQEMFCLNYHYYTPRLWHDERNSFDILCVCLSVCPSHSPSRTDGYTDFKNVIRCHDVITQVNKNKGNDMGEFTQAFPWEGVVDLLV